MAINITNSIGQHKIPQRITETKHTYLSCHTGSCMAHLNCFPTRAAGVNFWFFIAVPSGSGCWYKAKCGMWDAATQDRLRNKRAKLWIFREIAKWRLHAPWLTATAVVMCSRRRFSIFRRDDMFADVKNIAGDDQTTLMVDQNSAIYVCLRLQDRN